MRLKDLIAGKGNGDEVVLDGIRIPVPALRRLVGDGYENIRVYKESRTFSLWGKTCTACFSEEVLSTLAGSE